MDHGSRSGDSAACAGDTVDAGAVGVEVLESECVVEWEDAGESGEEVVV